MSRFVIIALLASAAPVTFMYEDADKAWAKVRTLQRTGASFELKDGRTETPLSIAELEAMVRRKWQPACSQCDLGHRPDLFTAS